MLSEVKWRLIPQRIHALAMIVGFVLLCILCSTTSAELLCIETPALPFEPLPAPPGVPTLRRPPFVLLLGSGDAPYCVDDGETLRGEEQLSNETLARYASVRRVGERLATRSWRRKCRFTVRAEFFVDRNRSHTECTTRLKMRVSVLRV